MSTTAVPSPLLNQGTVVPAEVLREAEFLDKLLQIRDDVLASKHPRIRLPAKVIEQVAPRFPQTTTRPATNGAPKDTTSPFIPLRPEASLQLSTSPILPAQRPFSAKSATSSIDPVLLTKSDHLIKAELQLKRQQIERLLKDQIDKKGRNNETEEREAYINVEECLILAHQRVPPVSGLQSTTNNSDGAESFDENSYYSSKANSWSSEEADPGQNGNFDATSPIVSYAEQSARQIAAQSRLAEPAVIDLDEEAYEPADDIEIYEPDPASRHEEAEEEDYSPPPADILPTEPPKGRIRDRGVTNYGDTNGYSNRQSPAGPVAPIQNPRKRRREERQAERRRRQQQQPVNERSIHSPEPYIKDEPQSPPPFIAYADSQPSKKRALPPFSNDVELVSTPESTRPQPLYYREQEPSSSTYRVYEEPSSPITNGSPQRKARRDDQDLRRVASLQYARRPYSTSGATGADVYAAPEPRQIREVSHAFAERSEAPIYREASARPPTVQRYIRERSRSPFHEYMPREHSPLLMGPPPRRIVVDQYGNKYYAAPADPVESSTPSRRMEIDSFQERARTREPTMRAPVRNEIYEEEVVQRMPPLRRRFGEASDFEIIESPSYRQREVSRRPVEVEYRPVPLYEEMGPPREYAPSRAYSMRPEVIRRDIPTGHTRHESIQPGSVRVSQPRYREVSIVHQEPFDNRPYISAPQGRRYVEEGPIEIAQEPYPPVYARY